MRTFAQQRPTGPKKSVRPEAQGRKVVRQHPAACSPPPLSQMVGKQQRQSLLRAGSDESEADVRIAASARPAHEVGRNPLLAGAHAAIQSKLNISSPHDLDEQEADHVADQVMRMPESPLPHTCPCGGGCPQCREPQSGRRSPGSGLAQASVADKTPASPIASTAGGATGHPLDPATRRFFERRFGYDFGRVRVHAGADGHAAARSVNARAFTVGNDIVFGSGHFAPHAMAGRRLIAHELAHVIQQGAAPQHGSPGAGHPGPRIGRTISGPRIQRQGPSPQPAPTPTLPQIYSQALAGVRPLDSRLHRFLSAAALNGARTTILTDSRTDAQGITTTTNFTLQVQTQSLPNAYAMFRRHPVAAPTGSGTTRTRTVDMTLLVDSSTGANAVSQLTETLYHEGLHLLLHMDGFLATAQQSSHGARLAAYRTVAQAHAAYAQLLAELDLLVNPHFQAQIAGPNPSGPLPPQVQQQIATLSRDAAQSIVTDLIEEKYIEDTVAPGVGRTRQTNTNLAFNEIANDLVNTLGMSQQQLASGANLAAMRRIINQATQILDAIDQSTSRPRTAPTPPGSTPRPRP